MSSIPVRMGTNKIRSRIAVYATGFGDLERCVVIGKDHAEGNLTTLLRMSPDAAEDLARELKYAAAEGRRRHQAADAHASAES